MAAQSIPSCRSWRCWFQDNFTALALFSLLIICLALLILLMHEDKIDDKYVTWMEGFTAGIFSALMLALKGATSGQHQGDTLNAGDNTTVVQAPPIIAAPTPSAPLENPATTPEVEPRPDLPVFAGEK